MKRWLHTHRDGIALAICFACALVAAQINDDRADARTHVAHSAPQGQGGAAMKDLLERMRGYVAKIRRAPEVAPTLTTLVLQDNIEALEQLEQRVAALEALHQRRSAEARDWALGAKV